MENFHVDLGEDLDWREVEAGLEEHLAHLPETKLICINPNNQLIEFFEDLKEEHEIKGYEFWEVEGDYSSNKMQNYCFHDALIMNLQGIPVDTALYLKKEALEKRMQVITYSERNNPNS